MAKYNQEILVAVAPQTAEGTADSVLQDVYDGVQTTLDTADGLLLGDRGSGEAESGITLTTGRKKSEKPFVAGSLTRSISDFLRREIRALTVAAPFCGNRSSVGGSPVDADLAPVRALTGLFNGAGWLGGAWGSGLGYRFAPGASNPCTVLVLYHGNAVLMVDCRAAVAIPVAPDVVTVGTWTVEVGGPVSAKALAFDFANDVDYGVQLSVSAPQTEGIGHEWGPATPEDRGGEEGTLSLTPTLQTFGDWNRTPPTVVEIVDRAITWTPTLFKTDTDKDWEQSQLAETDIANLERVEFMIGSAVAAPPADVARAVQFIGPKMELDEEAVAAIGSRAAARVSLTARETTANAEAELIFQ